MRLVDTENVIGKSLHRVGWKACVEELKKLENGRGILLDDFYERTYCYGKRIIQFCTVPWMTFVHEPFFANSISLSLFHHLVFKAGIYNICYPPYRLDQAKIGNIKDGDCVQDLIQSLPTLKAIVVLSDYLKETFEKYPGDLKGIPVHSIYHPTDLNLMPFNPDKVQRLVCAWGWFSKRVDILNRVKTPKGWHKILFISTQCEYYVNNLLKVFKDFFKEPWYDDVQHIVEHVPDNMFDILNSQTIQVCHYLDASGSNVLVDSIARCSPIIVNRIPPVENYIGKSYPLLYDSIDEIPSLIERWREGYEYLKAMDKSFLSFDKFRIDMKKIIDIYDF